ncbi:putative transport protein [Vibrio ishigakensis]|uniref:Putative transport protein n=2 Tax=Vibrio ishigakensis TaxID=1481914 RepID=A0A0B8NTA8_9VIBR|nr:putative transport protein [Vibrio ishigakensis]
MGYGLIGVLYAYYYKLVSQGYTEEEIEQGIDFLASLSAFTYYFAFLFIVISALFYFKDRKRYFKT